MESDRVVMPLAIQFFFQYSHAGC